jgi:hypothetical protein
MGGPLTAQIFAGAARGLSPDSSRPDASSHPRLSTAAMDSTRDRETAIEARHLAKSILVLKGSVMDSPHQDAVLKAADNWLKALEVLVSERESEEGADDRQDAVDLAGVQLVLAVTSWRSNRDAC